MRQHLRYLELAARINRFRTTPPKQVFFLTALTRHKSRLVWAVNRANPNHKTKDGHAEMCLLRKGGRLQGATVYVARTTRSKIWAIAKPCLHCETALRVAGVEKVVYTIGPEEYGILNFS